GGPGPDDLGSPTPHCTAPGSPDNRGASRPLSQARPYARRQHPAAVRRRMRLRHLGARPPAAAESGPHLHQLRPAGLRLPRLATARTALLEGSYRVARQELDAAHALHLRFPHLLLPADRYRQLRQWRPQAGLLADLLSESVGEIFRHSVGLADREWDSLFRE